MKRIKQLHEQELPISAYKKLLKLCYTITYKYLASGTERYYADVLLRAIAEEIYNHVRRNINEIYAVVNQYIDLNIPVKEKARLIAVRLASILGCPVSTVYRGFGRILRYERIGTDSIALVMPLLYDNPNTPLAMGKISEDEALICWVRKLQLQLKPEMLPRGLDYLVGLYTTYVKDDATGEAMPMRVIEPYLKNKNKELIYSRFGLNSRGKPYQCIYCSNIHRGHGTWCSQLTENLRDITFSFEDFI